MKKILRLCLIMLVCLTISAAQASPFCTALTDAFSAFNPESQGCRVDVSAGGQDFSATVQKGDGLWAVDLGQWGKVQLLSDKLVYLNGDTPLVLDLAPFRDVLRLIAEPERIGDNIGNTAEKIGLLALRYLVSPFTETAYSDHRLSLHLDVDNERLKEQLKEFIAALLQDADFAQGYPLISYVLEKAGMYCPEDPEEIAEYLAAQIPCTYTYDRYNDEYDTYERAEVPWRIEADLFVDDPGGAGPDIAFSGNIRLADTSWPVWFEMTRSDGRLVTHAEADTPFGGITVSFNGSDFMIMTREAGSARPYMTIEGTYEPGTGTIEAVILNDEGNNTGRITGYALPDSLDLTIRYYSDTIRIHLRNGGRYVYGKVSSASRYQSFDYDLLLAGTQDDGFRFRLTGENSDENGSHYYSLAYKDRGISLEFSYPYRRWRVNGKGNVQFSQEDLIRSLDCRIVTSRDDYSYEDVKQVTYEPGRLAALIDGQEYVLERTADTPQNAAWQFRVNGDLLYGLELELNETGDGKALSTVLLERGEALARVSFTPVAMPAAAPYDLSDAVWLTPEMIEGLIGMITRIR